MLTPLAERRACNPPPASARRRGDRV